MTGKPKIYVKTAESGRRSAQSFCSACGSGIYSSAAIDPPVFMLRVGTIRQRGELKPKSQMWCQSRLGWITEAWPTEELAKQANS